MINRLLNKEINDALETRDRIMHGDVRIRTNSKMRFGALRRRMEESKLVLDKRQERHQGGTSAVQGMANLGLFGNTDGRPKPERNIPKTLPKPPSKKIDEGNRRRRIIIGGAARREE